VLPRTTSSVLRALIRKTILSDIRTANMRSKNHKLNRAVQALLFGMVERGMDAEVQGDKGKLRAPPPKTQADGTARVGEEAMWAVVVTKELWRKGVWCAQHSGGGDAGLMSTQERRKDSVDHRAGLFPPRT
jgi:protein SDA1